MLFKKSVASNPLVIGLIRAADSFTLIFPVLVLFYQENGMSMREIYLLQFLYTLVVLAFNAPLGHFAQVKGCRSAIIMGYTMWAIGFTIYACSYGFFGFLLGSICIGFGRSFTDGAYSALLRNSLEELGRVGEYKRFEGRVNGGALGAEVLANILCGFLIVVSLRTPLIVDAIFFWLTLPLTFLLVDPVRVEKSVEKKLGPWDQTVAVMKYALRDHQEIKWLCLHASVVYALIAMVQWFIPPYFRAVGVPDILLGALWAGFNILGVIASLGVNRIDDRLGRRGMLILLIVLPVMSCFILGLSVSVVGLMFVAGFFVTRGMLDPIITCSINGHVADDIRVMVLSVRTFIGRILIVLGLFFGWVHDTYSLQAAFLSMGGVFLVLGGVVLAGLLRRRS